MPPITTSVFELFKIGPGPSSSHTIGPMAAAGAFAREAAGLPADLLARATGIRVHLFGSLSATGLGHGTDRAVLAGLSGYEPETCPPALLSDMDLGPGAAFPVRLGPVTLSVRPADVVFDALEHGYGHPNTLVFRLLAGEEVLLEKVAFSVGGGFIQWQDAPPEAEASPPYPYESMAELKAQLAASGLRLHDLLLANEKYLTQRGSIEIEAGLDRIMAVMAEAVDRGLNAEGTLPGPIGLRRKAKVLSDRARRSPTVQAAADRLLVLLDAYALAAAEENAAGHTIVTAPTSGSAGVVPSVLAVMQRHLKIEPQALRAALLAGAAVGFLAKHNASISGAEVGCQGEIGVASAMAAAMLAYAHGFDLTVTENAAEIALEHHLGMTCDPVAGYVQIPCIERNAMGAVKAYNAFLLATVEDPGRHVMDLDRVIWAMAQTGRDMCPKYRETAQGGLALRPPEC
jgi:L-serine dehydratase